MARTLAQVDARLTAEILNRAQDVNTEETRAEAVEDALASRLLLLDDRVKALEALVPQEPQVPPEPPIPPAQVPSGPQSFSRDGQVIENLVIDNAPNQAMTIGKQTGQGNSIYGKGFKNCILRNVTLRGRDWGALLIDMDDLVIDNVTVLDVNYNGIAIFGGARGRVQNSIIKRVGTLRDANGNPSIGDASNAYGMFFVTSDASHGVSGTGLPPTDWVVDHVTVEDSPIWMGFNAHEAKNLTLNDCVVRRAPRAFFFAGPVSVSLNRCQALECVTKTGGSQDKRGILLSGATASIVDCKVSQSYQPPSTVYAIYQSATITKATGNTIVTP